MILTSSSASSSACIPADVTESEACLDFASALLEHRPALSTYAQLLARERTAAEDLTQDTLERALRAEGRFKAGTNLRAWLMRIMRNLFTDGCRRSAMIRSVNAQIAISEVAPEPSAVGYVDLVSMADVDAALREIEPDHREIFELAYVKRLPYGAIAQQLRIPISTVGTRIWRAKAKLRRALKRAGLNAVPNPSREPANDVGTDHRPHRRRRAPRQGA
jgi:RNA polymerase sigma-70 factor (ECF subfamily)